jgi:hypothetical protein
MLTRHLNELMARLDRVGDIGCAEIRHTELLHWYGQERTTVNIWRDIQTKWEEVLESYQEKDIPLLVGEGAGVWVLVWGEGIQPDPKAWLKDLKALARPK